MIIDTTIWKFDHMKKSWNEMSKHQLSIQKNILLPAPNLKCAKEPNLIQSFGILIQGFSNSTQFFRMCANYEHPNNVYF